MTGEDLQMSTHTSLPSEPTGPSSVPNDLKTEQKRCLTEYKTIHRLWLQYIAKFDDKRVRFPGFHTIMQKKKKLPLICVNSRTGSDNSTGSGSSSDDDSDRSLTQLQPINRACSCPAKTVNYPTVSAKRKITRHLKKPFKKFTTPLTRACAPGSKPRLALGLP